MLGVGSTRSKNYLVIKATRLIGTTGDGCVGENFLQRKRRLGRINGARDSQTGCPKAGAFQSIISRWKTGAKALLPSCWHNW
jgi:hypothetical protein